MTALWCSALPELAAATSSAVDPTGSPSANDQGRVDEVRERYSEELMRLPGVIALGTTRLSLWSEAPEAVPPSPEALDHAILIGVEHESNVPEGRLFLEGAPIVVQVTGRFIARAGAAGSLHDPS